MNFNQLTLHNNPEASDTNMHGGRSLKFCATKSDLGYLKCANYSDAFQARSGWMMEFQQTRVWTGSSVSQRT
jgi:hypothetical protein